MSSRFIFSVLLVAGCLFPIALAQNNERVVGGQRAKKRVRRHLAYLFLVTQDGTYTCTGTVLGRKYVLTAAHCFDGIRSDSTMVSNSFVFIGLRTARPTEDTPSYSFESVFVHRGYRESDATLRNDVAIVELTSNIKRSEYHPVKLGKEPAEDTIVIGAGYGVLNEQGRPARFAMQTNLIAKRFQTCRSFETPFFQASLRRNVHVCAVSLGFPDEGRTDTCYGDSGGPLFRRKGNSLIQYAITSFGTSPCAAPGGTPWYARVSTYRKDIRRVLSRGSSGKFRKYN